MRTDTDVSFRCPECGQQVEDGFIEMVFELRDTNVTVSNVPAKVCPSCHQEFVDGYVAENVNRLTADDCHPSSVVCPQSSPPVERSRADLARRAPLLQCSERLSDPIQRLN